MWHNVEPDQSNKKSEVKNQGFYRQCKCLQVQEIYLFELNLTWHNLTLGAEFEPKSPGWQSKF